MPSGSNNIEDDISSITSIGDDAEFYVFSDDVEYSQNILGFIERKIVVSNNKDDKSYLDMSLMSKCKHNIIANSTFSFWGAYLNMNKDKIVIVPNLPFTGCKNIFTDDGWIVI